MVAGGTDKCMVQVAVKSVDYCGFHFRPTSPPFQMRRDLTIEAAAKKRKAERRRGKEKTRREV